MTSEAAASSNLGGGGRSEKTIEERRQHPDDRATFELTPLPLRSPSPPTPASASSTLSSSAPAFSPSSRPQDTRPQQPRQRQRQRQQYCRFFVLGGQCRYGENCAYSHELPPGGIAEARRLTPCPYYRQPGGCRYGDFCQLLHEDDPPTTTDGVDGGGAGGGEDDFHRSPIANHPVQEGDGDEGDRDDDDNPTCGICFEDVVSATGSGSGSTSSSKRYGLLSGCSHAFCLDCLRKWRRMGAGDHDSRRSCPACRATSDLVVPSRRYVPDGEEKDEIVEGYKTRLSKIRCRNFDSTGGGRFGSCPFGKECLYAHLDERGNDVKSLDHGRRRRRRRNNRGGGGGSGLPGDLDLIVTFFNLLDMYGLEFFEGESGDDEDDDDEGFRNVD